MKTEDKTAVKCWQYEDVDAQTARIRFYGDVRDAAPVDWWTGEQLDGDYITPAGLAEDLEKAKGKSVLEIAVNSCGGDAYVGLAIHNVLRGLSMKKIVTIDGIAASAAATIACAGDVIRMHPGSLFMIHNAAVGLMDTLTQDELKQYARRLEAVEKASAAIYAEKSGLDESTIRNMMTRETWLTGSEAVEKGFADEIVGAPASITFNRAERVMVCNGIGVNLDKVRVPDNILEAMAPATAPEPTAPAATIPDEKEETKMDLEKISQEYPELVAQIREQAAAEAVAAERARLQEIEQIANTIGDAALVQSAKYSKPMSARDLAFEAMQQAAKAGKSFMTARAAETAPAEAIQSAAAQDDIEAETEKAHAESLARAVIAAKSMK